MTAMGKLTLGLLLATLALTASAREPDFRKYRLTRSGGDSIQYYTRQRTEYQHGFMRTGGGFDYLTLDLCTRICGVMDTIAAESILGLTEESGGVD